jgi:NitT/TauT family transport system permease protein
MPAVESELIPIRRKLSGSGSSGDQDNVLIWQIVTGLLLVGGWEGFATIYGSTWTSKPSLIAVKLFEWVQGDLYLHVLTTATEMVVGVVIGTLCGTVAGLVLGRIPPLAITLRPIIVALYSIPLIALAPLLIMFFGLDMMPKIVLISIVVFFLLFFNTLSGSEAVDDDLVATLDLMGATRLEEFQKVVAPACMVWIIGGVKNALPYALVAATTGEMLAARRGLGYLLSQAGSQFNMTALYSVLFLLMIMGLVVSELAVRGERWLLRWRYVSE